ncbi:MAG: four helix bundle protein [Clostridiales bacterium]|nr:four helix bundle protein [Clostridiales bacterium]
MKEGPILIKSKAFAIRIINLYKFLTQEKQEYVLSKQILKSGTSIGANVREAARAQSTADFVAKNNIALKEADETCYWLELLHETNYINNSEFDSIYVDVDELIKLLVSIVKTTKQKKE